MSEAEQLKQRIKLMLRAERVLGASGVPMIALENESAIPDAAPDVRPMPVETHVEPRAVGQREPAPAIATAAPSALFAGAEPAAMPFGPNRPPFDSPVLSKPKKIELLAAMDTNEVKGCPKCILCKTRTNTVFGEGDADARLMFIGEGPGENEDLQGRPFVGRAGELLGKQIAAMGLSRERVFIANIVKCRPPNNRVPAADEVAACTPYLERQIEIIRPQVIVTLGLPSTQYMLQTKSSMSKLRGQWAHWRGIKLMPTYHPAYLLRNYTDATRAAVWSDLKQVMSELGLKKNA
jgi:DNA polymerase